MILFFHFLCLLARYIVINISKSIRQNKEVSDDTGEKEAIKNLSRSYLQNIREVKEPVYQNGTIRFFPPIYVQRYETVALILQNFCEEGIIRKVVDFGCSELGLFPYLKNIESIVEILEVDINEELLKRSEIKAAPLTSDYLMSKGARPLDVYLLVGSVADYDDHLAGCDTVICIELIEHLAEDTFFKMPYNIFHQIKPKVAIFTTPNADFNSLFPNFEGMRHEDHKFEWSRKEFYLWTQGIISQYPEYSVRFYGVGAGPEGTENLGCCSQVAVFKRSDDVEPFSSAREEPEGVMKYKLIKHYKYPVFVDTRTVEEKVLHEIQYQVSYLNTLSKFYNDEENESEIPVSVLGQFVEDFGLSDEEILNILKNDGMELRMINESWHLIMKESEVNSSDGSFEEREWLEKNLSQTFYSPDAENCENWDSEYEKDAEEDEGDEEEEFRLEDKLELTNFQTARSLEESNVLERAKYVKEEYACMERDKTHSEPSSSNKLNNLLVVPEVSTAVREAAHKLSSTKSRIPRKTGPSGVASSVKETPCVREPFRGLPKSHSLDSCIENISSQTEFYLTPEGRSPLRNVRSFSSGRSKRMMNESGSSLFSSSIDRAGDSGYPFSYSSPDFTPELLTENEMSRSTSPSRASDVAFPRGQAFREGGVVENGDLANNNRDLEGNNVEGLMGEGMMNERDANDNMFFPEMREFPLWLLNLGDLAQRPLYVPVGFEYDDDEGVGDDTSSDSNESLEPDDFHLYFDN